MQTLFTPRSHHRCSPHLVLGTFLLLPDAVSITEPAKSPQHLQKQAAGEGEKPHRTLVTAWPTSTAQFIFVSPHQCEGNKRSERSFLLLALSSLLHYPGYSLCPCSSCHQTSPASAAVWHRSWPDPATLVAQMLSPTLLCADAGTDMK